MFSPFKGIFGNLSGLPGASGGKRLRVEHAAPARPPAPLRAVGLACLRRRAPVVTLLLCSGGSEDKLSLR